MREKLYPIYPPCRRLVRSFCHGRNTEKGIQYVCDRCAFEIKEKEREINE